MKNSHGSSLSVAVKTFPILWQRILQSGIVGFSVVRERGWLLAWDRAHWLYVLDGQGRPQSQRQFSGLRSASGADDGSGYVAVGQDGEIWVLAPDLMPRWEKKLSGGALAVAVDAFGYHLAVSGVASQLRVYTADGETVSKTTTPRPLHHIRFVPASVHLIASSDYGLVAAFDLEGQVQWRDGLVANVGHLCTDGYGEQILLATFGEGIQRYSVQNGKQGRWTMPTPVSLVAQSFDGALIVTSGRGNRIMILRPNGQPLVSTKVPTSPTALAVDPMGMSLFVGFHDGRIVCYSLGKQ
ncbi:MAG: PQQ-binding-like beta-propeller repeat protein [Gemmataceae bacterium]